MHRAFGVHNIRTYHPLLEIETKQFLKRLLTDPSKYLRHIRRCAPRSPCDLSPVTDNPCRYAGGVTLLVVYGYEVTSDNDEFLLLAEESVNLLANRIASGGGIWPVDIFPSRG
jgi:hypothetical protein